MTTKILTKDTLIRCTMAVFGAFVTALGVNLFIIPHGLLAAGISGISIIFQYLTDIQAGVFVLVLNIPIFLIGIRKLDKVFGLISLLAMLSLSFFLILTEPLSNVARVVDPLASCVYGGLFTGVGVGTIFKNRASLGGTDLISILLKKKFEISISTMVFLIDASIVLIGATINSFSLAVYTLICILISSSVINKILVGLDKKKLLLIVTKREQEVSEALMKRLKRGVTFLDGSGAYTKKRRQIIYCVVSFRQLARVKKILSDIDDESFISIIDTSEILGGGFKKPVF